MAARTRAQLNSDADTYLPDNTTGDISPADIRQRVKDLADSAKLSEDLATVATTGAYVDLSGKPTLSTVASTGAYSDLTGKPTLGTAASKDTGTAAGQVPVLDGSGLIPSALLPSYVDDVLEFNNQAAFPATGETGKIYVAKDTNKTYRWGGSSYTEISASPGSTDAVPEGSVNLYFTGSRVLATVLAGLSTATNAAITATDTVLSALGKLQKQITDLTATVAGKAGLAAGNTFTARQTIIGGGSGNSAMNTATASLGEIEVRGNGTGAAMMGFHRPSAYASYFGLDTDNKWKVGGWSAGAVAYEIVHMGNSTTLLGTIVGRGLTISSSVPSGGVDGDVWFQI